MPKFIDQHGARKGAVSLYYDNLNIHIQSPNYQDCNLEKSSKKNTLLLSKKPITKDKISSDIKYTNDIASTDVVLKNFRLGIII